MKNLAILGATGSIGVNTLNVVRAYPDRYRVVALAAGANVELLREQIVEFAPLLVSVREEMIAERLRTSLAFPHPVILWGTEGYKQVATADCVDMVVSALAGAVGLLPTLAAISAGKDIALANKEVLVMAGDLVITKALSTGSKILPVDSEHSAIFQCLLGNRHEDIKRIILTASGGPFLHLPIEALASVTPAQALSHPNWRMGKKITIDSATMINKGLEVIEARWLFGTDFDKICIHIHPQSIVHSLVEYRDGSMLAQLGVPDMKTPIAYALSFPERTASLGPNLDLIAAGKLEFFPPDLQKYPGIKLAYEAGKLGGTMPAVLNAANESAVAAFIDERISFPVITKVIEETMSLHSARDKKEDVTIEEILAADCWARAMAGECIARLASC